MKRLKEYDSKVLEKIILQTDSIQTAFGTNIPFTQDVQDKLISVLPKVLRENGYTFEDYMEASGILIRGVTVWGIINTILCDHGFINPGIPYTPGADTPYQHHPDV